MVYTGPLRRDYGYLPPEEAAQRIRADLLAHGYTDDDLDWLISHGWEPMSPIVDIEPDPLMSRKVW